MEHSRISWGCCENQLMARAQQTEWSVRQCRWQSFRQQGVGYKAPGQLTGAGSLRLRGKSTGKAAHSHVLVQMPWRQS